MTDLDVPHWPGSPFPLGATWDGEGTNFALFAPAAESVALCLFDGGGREERVELEEVTYHVWHGYLPRVGPRQRYGFRVDGPYDAARGLRWNPSKLLVDPYARALDGEFSLDDAVFGYQPSRDDTVQDHRDSAPYVPKSVVVHDAFPWGEEHHRPHIPWADTVIYELHVKGFTAQHPDIPAPIRGTYAGLAHPAAVEHLQRLGITAVELMPVHHFVSEPALLRRGLVNYWGYNTLGFFAPHAAYSSSGSRGEQVREFKAMVRALHAAGIEVILDVVYNHTAEGDETGPTLAFRGIDNSSYYRLRDDDPRRYLDYTGTGNTLNAQQPHVLQLIMDSLRYWVTEMHVDGFRFDLAAALARSFHDVDKLSAFFDIIQQDPVLSQVKLIAEPWDVGEGGYQVGNFPPLWSEWNGKYRDSVRDYWRGTDQTLGEFANRLTGSSDLYAMTGRRPYASINFITAHDGFTLRDLVSYNDKHNEANGENNNDGESTNRSWNCGEEGPTEKEEVNALRARQQRNFLTTLFLSQGVPMILGGDELGRTQQGNNNAYCQDNEISWFDWENTDDGLMAFAARVIGFRNEHPVFRRRRWFVGHPLRGADVSDIGWFKPDGELMTDEDWQSGFARSLGMFLNGQAIPTPDPRGEPIVDDSFYLLFNAHYEAMPFKLPTCPWGDRWEKVIDTNEPVPDLREHGELHAGDEVSVQAYSVVVLRRLDS